MDLAMNVFLVFVRDHNFCQLLPKELASGGTDNGRVNSEFKPGTDLQARMVELGLKEPIRDIIYNGERLVPVMAKDDNSLSASS
jgi:hypothetical protein